MYFLFNKITAKDKHNIEIIIHMIDAFPYESIILPEIKGPIKYPIAKHWERIAKPKPFLLTGVILNIISVDVGKNDEVPMQLKMIANNIINKPYFSK